jgi:hypothetical protein
MEEDKQPRIFAGVVCYPFAIASRAARPDNQVGEGSELCPQKEFRMTRSRWLPAAALIWALTSDAAAQVIVAPPVIVPATMVSIQNGIGFNVQRRHQAVTVFYGTRSTVAALIPAGSIPLDGRITVRVMAPTVVPALPALFPAQAVDLRGVDLDVVGPEVLHPGGRPNLARIPVPPEKMEIAKKAAAPAPPQANVEPPKKEIPAPPKPVPPPAGKAAAPGLPQPKAEPLKESRRLTDLGVSAFHLQQYGLAAQRFRQAIEIEPAQSIPYFLLAQAYMALGKYKEAVSAIENGMRRQQDWPLSAFEPRVDLYKGIEDDWFAHKKQLADVQALHPDRPVYLFLQAYQWWFDGQRDQAALMFERARLLAPANAFIEAFLKVIPKLAAK